MSKRYKIWMFVLLGVGAVMIIGGLSSFGESVGLAIFGIIFGLLIALPMLILYKPLADKKKAKKEAEEKEKQRKAKEAKRAEEQKRQAEKEAAEQEKQRKKAEWERTHSTMDVWLDKVYQPQAKAAMKKVDSEDEFPFTTMKRFYKENKLRLAVIVDDEKIGEIINDAETVSDKWHNSERAYFSPSFIKDFNPETGEMEITCCVRITFTLS